MNRLFLLASIWGVLCAACDSHPSGTHDSGTPIDAAMISPDAGHELDAGIVASLDGGPSEVDAGPPIPDTDAGPIGCPLISGAITAMSPYTPLAGTDSAYRDPDAMLRRTGPGDTAVHIGDADPGALCAMSLDYAHPGAAHTPLVEELVLNMPAEVGSYHVDESGTEAAAMIRRFISENGSGALVRASDGTIEVTAADSTHIAGSYTIPFTVPALTGTFHGCFDVPRCP